MTAPSNNAAAQVRVMVVDDSALMRKLLTQALTRDPGIVVVDTAMDGQYALDHLKRVKPDVVLLDIDMPRLGGLETLDQIISEHRLPVVICSAKTTTDAHAAIDALNRGAIDVVAKPSLAALTSGEAAAEIISKVRNAAGASVRVARKRNESTPAVPTAAVPTPSVARTSPAVVRTTGSGAKILAIGTSTGGPPALELVLGKLSANFPIPIVVVQHMPEGFTAMLADRLDINSPLRIHEARDGDALLPGHAYIAPGGAHLRVARCGSGFVAKIDRDTPTVSGHRPSVDVLFKSVAEAAGGEALALVMTGMGSDGAEGSAELARRGAPTIAQTPDTCVCYGMPKSIIDRGLARTIAPLNDLAAVLTESVRTRRTPDENLALTT